MALIYTEDQQMLRDAAKEFLEERSNVAELRRLRDEGVSDGFSREIWSEMAELGWSGIVVPEQFDGLEFGYVGAGVVMEEMGRNLSMSPFFTTAVVGATAIRLAGSQTQQETLLPKVAAGEHLLALAVDEGPRHNPSKISMTAAKTPRGYVLNGSKQFVLDGGVADTLIVVARTSGESGTDGLTLFLVDGNADGVSKELVSMVDCRNVATISFDGVTVGDDAVLGEVDKGWSPLEIILDTACICLSAEMLGMAREAFERTVVYLRERKQFGVAIGSFQALQHRAAHLLSEIELAKSAVLKALQCLDENNPLTPGYASMAKAKLCKVLALATNEAVQMHGGIGMTDEFDIGFFIKRGRAARATFGDYEYHAERFARLNRY